jgi:hypothetical protein
LWVIFVFERNKGFEEFLLLTIEPFTVLEFLISSISANDFQILQIGKFLVLVKNYCAEFKLKVKIRFKLFTLAVIFKIWFKRFQI